ncbi:hypothetical protein KSD_51460 [Ktedonobacter sp. SOSP1-85]|uniref:hypothetical protein n=1 Tax=Ktedonobacter sp. SOSP1-85 TaxID=2778367 RepID=UPI001916822C|nr:hypothetical protein [Ktedonobacter sp. SOSP1-85]GHO77375.1 hypothetical protein KSD_51460 [Ktedonobacter sp. SOSP1-85]
MSEHKDQQWAVDEMADWLAHPMEFGERPTEAHVIYENEVQWPSVGFTKIFLVQYEMSNGVKGIGFTGPITWSFIAIDWENWTSFTHEELIYCYAGWYIQFTLSHQENYVSESTPEAKQEFFERLRRDGYQDLLLKDQFTLDNDEGGTSFYTVEANKDGKSFYAIGTVGEYKIYEKELVPMKHLPPFFYYLGQELDPFTQDDEDA